MANQLFKNNAGATLNGTIAIGNTTINVAAGQGARFPAPTAGDYFLLTIYEKDVGGVEFNYEVVQVTARTADTLTVVRDFEGLVVAGGGTSGGWAYPSSVGLNPSQVVYLDLRYTAYACGNTLVKDDNLASLASAATARINLGLGNVENKTFAVGTADATHAATSKTTPVDADEIPMADSAASWGLKKLTWANIKATLKTYFDTLYATLGGNTFTGAQVYGDQILSRGMTKDMGMAFLDKGNSGTTSQTLDYTAGSHQKLTVTGAFTLNAVSNWPPTGNLGEILLELTNGASSAVTWPTVNWVKSDGTTTTTFASNGVTLQSSGTDWVLLWSRDAGTTVYGKIMR